MGVDETRFFKNKAASSSSAKTSSSGSDDEQWDSQTCTTVARKLMKKCIDHYEGGNNSHDASSRSSYSMGTLYHGALGARVYLRLRMAQHLKSLKPQAPSTKKVRSSTRSSSDSEINDLLKKALRTAREAVEIETERMQRHSSDPRVTLLEGSLVGAKALLSVLLYQLGQEEEAKEEATELLEFLEEHTKSMDPGECEVLYGRAGALQAILFLRQELSEESFGSELVVDLAQVIVEEGLKTAAASASRQKDNNSNNNNNNNNNTKGSLPLLWQWHGKGYLGAAHGVVGILHTLLCLSPFEMGKLSWNDQKGDFSSLLKETIRGLDSLCWPQSGNLKSSIDSSSSDDRLVHWCHGSPGHVLLLVKAWEIFQDPSYLEDAKQLGNNVIWPRGLLRKGVGLCHGISGNAYAMLALGRPTGNVDQKSNKDTAGAVDGGESGDPKLWMKRACYFAAFSLETWSELEGVPDQPYSVFVGAGGLSLLMMDLGTLNHHFTTTQETSIRDARFPLYDF